MRSAWPTVTLDSDVQSEKAYSAIVFTDSGNVISSRAVHFSNSEAVTSVSLFGKTTVFKEEQPEKARYPMVVTLFGMITVTTDVPEKAYLAISLTGGVSGMVISGAGVGTGVGVGIGVGAGIGVEVGVICPRQL